MKHSQTLKLLAILGLSAFMHVQTASAHCQIPCGIYGDDARFTSMLEDVDTLRKSVDEINKLSAQEDPNYNQLVRWVMNKETHADYISKDVHEYFLAQRIKEGEDKYEEKLVALHRIIVLSMQVKQTTSLEKVDALETAIRTFHDLYHHDH